MGRGISVQRPGDVMMALLITRLSGALCRRMRDSKIPGGGLDGTYKGLRRVAFAVFPLFTVFTHTTPKARKSNLCSLHGFPFSIVDVPLCSTCTFLAVPFCSPMATQSEGSCYVWNVLSPGVAARNGWKKCACIGTDEKNKKNKLSGNGCDYTA